MTGVWNRFGFRVGMPQMAPGAKLSEVELFKVLGDFQWVSIAQLLGRPTHEVANELGERLYASFVDFELCFGERHSPESLGEGAQVEVRNRVQVYANRFIEGLSAIDDREIPDELLEKVATKQDLAAKGVSWASISNAFIAQEGSNQKLKVWKPAGIDELEVPKLRETPSGISDHERVQTTGEIEELGAEGPALPLHPVNDAPIHYTVMPEHDLNGAGLLYFARYPAMLNYGERLLLCERLARPVSRELHSCLSTEHRRIFYFANANAGEKVRVILEATLLPPDRFPETHGPARYRTPFKLCVRGDLYRSSDGVLMASSRVRKALRVPGNAKAVLAEAERLQRSFP